jgi:hypothetical protein
MKRNISKEERALNKLRSLTLEYEKQHTANREFERQRVVEERDAYLSKNGVGEVSKSGVGQIQIKVTKYDYLFLEPEKEIKVDKKYLKPHLKNQDKYTVYMGYETDEIDSTMSLAREDGLNIQKLEAVEDWGYTFIAVENRDYTFPTGHKLEGERMRWSPFDTLQLAEEMEIRENDFRERKYHLSTFLISARKIVGREIPGMVLAQLHTIDQVYSGNAVEVN